MIDAAALQAWYHPCIGSPPACGDSSRAAKLHALRSVHQRSIAIIVGMLQSSYCVLPAAHRYVSHSVTSLRGTAAQLPCFSAAAAAAAAAAAINGGMSCWSSL